MGIKHLQGVFCQEVILGKEKKHNEREAGIVQKGELAFYKPMPPAAVPCSARASTKPSHQRAVPGDWVEICEGSYSGRQGELLFKRLALHGKGMQYKVRVEERFFRGSRLQRVVQRLVITKKIKLLQHRLLGKKG